MDAVEIQARKELDNDILAFVRGMQQHAPVTEDSVYAFEKNVRHRRVTLSEIRDRLAYLTSAQYLKAKNVFEAGETLVKYEITADGMDLLDGNIPPRNWGA
jgi:hypothetical protein